MAHVLLREKAQKLRENGESISRIATQLKASKSTVSYWCRDIALTKEQLSRLAKRQERAGALGRLRSAEKKRAARQRAVNFERERGAAAIGSLNQRDIFMVGVALYWGEGCKSGNEECGLTNSNPDIIRTFILWLQQIYKIPLADLILRVSINETHRNRIRQIERYWSRVTGVPQSQFTKPSFIHARARKVYAHPEQHFGTLRIKVRRATALRRRIQGSIERIARLIQ